MQDEINQLEEYLKERSNEANIFSAIVGSIEENTLLSSNLHDGDKLAIAYEQKCNTLKGAVKFKPMVFDHAGFSFTYHGSSEKTCIVLSFDISSPNAVSVAAQVDPTIFEKRGTRETNRTLFVSSFLQIRMKYLCEFMSEQTLYNSFEIPSCLRRFEHFLGRLESTASEFGKLNERYTGKVSLCQISNSSAFHLKINFRSQTGSALLGASFEINEAYPLSPLNVCLDAFDSKVNVEMIQKSMVKNAKPGFGYLSRICDVVEASLP